MNINNLDNVRYLYHATFEPLLDSIKQDGLGATTQTYYEDSIPGVVYLAFDPDVAVSYAEANDIVDDDWLDNIIILKIPISKLNIDSLFVDNNVLIDEDSEIYTLEYHETIPYSDIEDIIYE